MSYTKITPFNDNGTLDTPTNDLKVPDRKTRVKEDISTHADFLSFGRTEVAYVHNSKFDYEIGYDIYRPELDKLLVNMKIDFRSQLDRMIKFQTEREDTFYKSIVGSNGTKEDVRSAFEEVYKTKNSIDDIITEVNNKNNPNFEGTLRGTDKNIGEVKEWVKFLRKVKIELSGLPINNDIQKIINTIQNKIDILNGGITSNVRKLQLDKVNEKYINSFKFDATLLKDNIGTDKITGISFFGYVQFTLRPILIEARLLYNMATKKKAFINGLAVKIGKTLRTDEVMSNKDSTTTDLITQLILDKDGEIQIVTMNTSVKSTEKLKQSTGLRSFSKLTSDYSDSKKVILGEESFGGNKRIEDISRYLLINNLITDKKDDDEILNNIKNFLLMYNFVDKIFGVGKSGQDNVQETLDQIAHFQVSKNGKLIWLSTYLENVKYGLTKTGKNISSAMSNSNIKIEKKTSDVSIGQDKLTELKNSKKEINDQPLSNAIINKPYNVYSVIKGGTNVQDLMAYINHKVFDKIIKFEVNYEINLNKGKKK